MHDEEWKMLLYEVYLSCAVGKGITPHANARLNQNLR